MQLDPPHRASRYFRSHERMRSIQPDAYALLETPAGERALFLEWDGARQAGDNGGPTGALPAPTTPPVGRSRTTGLLPRVLIVFEDDLAADHFLRIAAEAIARAEVPLPLLVSDRRRIDEHGPLGRAWRSVERSAAVSLD